MSKYCFDISGIDTCTTHGKVLSKVKPNSLVLECGSSSGYMTRFMRDVLGCTVHIIESDPLDYVLAAQYSDMPYHGNLNECDWVGYFYEYRYDCIMFADVLEHLNDPLTVLRYASTLLKPDGRIVISLPNICHNDMLVQMFYGNWNYRKLGLLDDTHIRFFGENNLDDLVKSAGLKIVDKEYKTIPTQCTEQKYYGNINPELLAALKKRPGGEIYQFILVCEVNQQ